MQTKHKEVGIVRGAWTILNVVRYVTFCKPVIIWPILKQKYILMLTAPKTPPQTSGYSAFPKDFLMGTWTVMTYWDNVFLFSFNCEVFHSGINLKVWCLLGTASFFFFQLKEGFHFTSLARKERKLLCFKKQCTWCLHLGRCSIMYWVCYR